MNKKINQTMTQSLAVLALSAAVSVPMQATAGCNPFVAMTTPDEAFSINNNGTVTHNETGLMWKVCAEGQTWNNDGTCTGSASEMTWQQALQQPQTVNTSGGYAGYADWRLPNIKELSSIAEMACFGPALNSTIFDSAPPQPFWSSSPISQLTNQSWVVHFDRGNVTEQMRTGSWHLRLVRNVQ